MADEETGDDAKAVSVVPNKKLLIMTILGVTILLGGGGAVWFLMGSDSDKPSQEGDQVVKTGEQEKKPGPIRELDPFVLNLADQEELRYLKMTIQLELDRPESETDFEARTPALRDSLLVLLTSKESQHLRTVNGKRRIREEILARANHILNKGKITNVYFTDFIIQ